MTFSVSVWGIKIHAKSTINENIVKNWIGYEHDIFESSCLCTHKTSIERSGFEIGIIFDVKNQNKTLHKNQSAFCKCQNGEKSNQHLIWIVLPNLTCYVFLFGCVHTHSHVLCVFAEFQHQINQISVQIGILIQ